MTLRVALATGASGLFSAFSSIYVGVVDIQMDATTFCSATFSRLKPLHAVPFQTLRVAYRACRPVWLKGQCQM